MRKLSTLELLSIGVLLIEVVDFFTASDVSTREINDNNPFGVTFNPGAYDVNAYPGIIGADTPLYQFSLMQFGINAGFNLLLDNYFNQGTNTIDGIGTKWSGDHTGGYANSLAALTGLTPGVPLSYWIDGINIMNGISKLENGAGEQLPYTQLALGLLAGGFMG